MTLPRSNISTELECLRDVAHAMEALIENNWLCIHKEDLDERNCIGCEAKLAFERLADHFSKRTK